MYIKRISASNIFSYDRFSVKLNKFNVIIGPNAAGKSNFIEILNFLKDIVKLGLEEAINVHGDISFLRNINLESKRNISIKFVIGCDDPKKYAIVTESPLSDEHQNNKKYLQYMIRNCDYELEIELNESNPYKWRVFREDLSVSIDLYESNKRPPQTNQSSFEMKNNNSIKNVVIEITKSKDKGEDKVDINYVFPENMPDKYNIYFRYPTFRTVSEDTTNTELKSILEKDNRYQLFSPLYEFFENIQIYDINKNNIIKSEYSKSKKKSLECDGSNLKWVIERIFKYKEKRERFLRLIKDFLPFIETFSVKHPQNNKDVELTFTEKYNRKELLPLFLMSDGTIDISIFIILLFFEEKKPLIILEDPLRNIHPQLIAKLVNVIKEVSEDLNKQIILTTHNPEIIKFCEAEDIIAISRNNRGFSEILRLNEKRDIEVFLKNKLGLHDLFIENLL